MGDIIESEEDIDNAIKMGRWITNALVAKMQTHLQVIWGSTFPGKFSE